MIQSSLRYFCAVAIGLTLYGSADTKALRTTIEQWVEMVSKTNEEQSRWTREKQILESSKEGLAQELTQIQERLTLANEKISEASFEDQKMIEEKQKYDQARESLADGLEGIFAKLPAVIKIIPDALRNDNVKLDSAIKKYQEFKSTEKEKSLGNKLNAVVTILSELETFNQKIWKVDETKEVNGKDYIVSTLYFGLGTAYSADENETVALQGVPTPEGWIFSEIPDKEAPAEIRTLIATATGEGDIQFAKIPVLIK